MPSRYRHSSTTEASSGALWKLSDRRSLNHSVRYLDSVNQVALAPLPGSQNIIQTHLDSCEQYDFTGLRLKWSQSGLDSWLSRAGGTGAVGPRSACGEWQLKGEMEHRPGPQEGQRFTRAQKSCPLGEHAWERSPGSNHFHSSGALVPVGKQKKSRLLQEVFWVFGSLL